MFKFYFILLAFISCFQLHSQDFQYFEASYDIYYNTAIPNTKKSKLQIDKKNKLSIFHIFKNEEKQNIIKEGNNITLVEKGDDRYVNMNFNNDTLISKELIKGKSHYVKESIPGFKWNLNYTDVKKIGDLICRKATVSFRGRNYISWYTPEIPLPYGPYKFHGLPGLIIEIYDETHRYTWNLISYKFNNDISFIKVKKPLKTINLMEYSKLRYSNSAKINTARLPRGVQTQIIDVPRSGIEIKFPWEE